MSLPPGFLDELRSRSSLTQVVGRKVMWDARKSNQAKGDMWSPCPFHQEKTASFHVDDRKGYYYCFGCHAKGDAISFVKETENVSFMEAVEILAGEVGMQMPARDPRAQEKADRRTLLADVMEQAVQHFRLQLRAAGGGAARDYLAKRGLSDAALERWEIGFAPDAWQSLWDHLRGKSVPEELIMAAGLAKPSTRSNGRPYDTFRGRIMFPIRDPRGRCVAFGGRAMDPDDNAKYLNSPETELFDKSRTLFNHGPARTAAGKGQPLLVAEGYMDVIALSEAGFGASVAGLGTAITEHHLTHLWRISDEPIIALDGDTAGLRAAMRLIDLALPMLEAGKSLRFALMPEGQDPDDLLRAKGAKAVQAVLENAMPMVNLLWQRETDGRNFDSPERKAALDKALKDKILLIKDPSIRKHYGQAINDLRWQLFRPQRPKKQGSTWKPRGTPAAPRADTKSSALVAAGDHIQTQLREAVILATILTTPEVLRDFLHELEDMHPSQSNHAHLRDQMVNVANAAPDDAAETLAAAIREQLGAGPLENLMALRHVAISPSVRNPGDIDLAKQTLAEEFAKLDAHRGLNEEIEEAEEDLSGLADEAVTWRLREAAETRNRAMRSGQEDSTEYVIGKNGARIDRDERSRFDSLLEQIGFPKQGD